MLDLKNISAARKILFLALFAVAIILVISLGMLQVQKQSTLVERQAKVQAQVESALSIVQYYQNQVEFLGLAQAQGLAMDAIRAMRYDNSNYLWITNSQSTMLMHPIKPELDGQDLSGFQDVNGKLLFQEFSQIGLDQGKGYIFYAWTHPSNNQIANKMSYVTRMPEWDWIIGSGLWIQDIEETYQVQLVVFGLVCLMACLLLSSVFYLVGREVVLPLRRLKKRVYEISNGNLAPRLNQPREDEVGDICNGIDLVLERLQGALMLAKQTSVKSVAMTGHIRHASDGLHRLIGESDTAEQEVARVTSALIEESQKLADTSCQLSAQLDYFQLGEIGPKLPHELNPPTMQGKDKKPNLILGT